MIHSRFSHLILSTALVSTQIATAETLISHPARRLVDRIVAVVDSKPILSRTVSKKLESNGLLIKISSYPVSSSADKIDQALQDEINLALVKREIKRLDLTISDAALDAQVEQIVAQSNSTIDGLKAFLQSQGKTMESYKEDIREQMLIYQFQGRVIMPMVKGAQIREQSRFKKIETNNSSVLLSTRQILVKVGPELNDAEQESRKQLINTVHQRLLDGMTFIEAEKLYSDLDSGRKEAPAAEHTLRDLLPQIAEKVGEIDPSSAMRFTTPIRTPQGWHIFYVEKRELKGPAQSPEEQQAEVSRLLQEQMQLWLKSERAKVKIEIKKI